MGNKNPTSNIPRSRVEEQQQATASSKGRRERSAARDREPGAEKVVCREFMVFCNEGMTNEWKKNRSLPLVDVVQKFEVYEADSGGSQGKVSCASAANLENAFGSSHVETVIPQILASGEIKNMRKNSVSA